MRINSSQDRAPGLKILFDFGRFWEDWIVASFPGFPSFDKEQHYPHTDVENRFTRHSGHHHLVQNEGERLKRFIM